MILLSTIRGKSKKITKHNQVASRQVNSLAKKLFHHHNARRLRSFLSLQMATGHLNLRNIYGGSLHHGELKIDAVNREFAFVGMIEDI
ncbi:hypothetical protein DMA11_22865 [Marinilabiliaceae bacterium JC017]|nr:hypothetical protein DMA11_22865 [Marinilabiliaceae bacterium JC017]